MATGGVGGGLKSHSVPASSPCSIGGVFRMKERLAGETGEGLGAAARDEGLSCWGMLR